MNIVDKYGDEIPFDVFLKLSDEKVVKIENRGEGVKERIRRYAGKGIEYIYANKEDFVVFLNRIRSDVDKVISDTSAPREKRVRNLNDGYEMVKESMANIGLNEDVAAIALEVSEKSVSLINEQPNIFKFFSEFKKKCSGAYMRSTLVAWTVAGMLETYDWANPSMHEKLNLAAILRDVLLSNEDIKMVKEKDPSDLPFSVKNHPVATAALIESSRVKLIPSDVGDIIRQHHEKPDGSGFPAGLTANRISKLSILLIVADDFVETMIKYGFEPSKKEDVLTEIWQRYSDDKFISAVKSIKSILAHQE